MCGGVVERAEMVRPQFFRKIGEGDMSVSNATAKVKGAGAQASTKDAGVEVTAERPEETTSTTATEVEESTSDGEPTSVEDQDKPGAPWDGDTFDADRAAILVANLRAENKELRAKAHKAESERISELEALLAEREAELATARETKVKEALLVERGLPLNLINALSGAEEKQWEEMADMLKALKDAGAPKQEEVKITPDPVQTATDAAPGGDAARLALANQLFSSK